MDVKTIKIDDKTYILVDKIIDVETYFYLSNIADTDDILVRKLDKENPEFMIPLKDEAEYDKAMLVYLNKQMELM